MIDYINGQVVHGAIALQPLRRQLPGFDAYFSQLTEEYFKEVAAGAEPRNPWYEEYYQAYCNCSHHSQAGQHSHCSAPLTRLYPGHGGAVSVPRSLAR